MRRRRRRRRIREIAVCLGAAAVGAGALGWLISAHWKSGTAAASATPSAGPLRTAPTTPAGGAAAAATGASTTAPSATTTSVATSRADHMDLSSPGPSGVPAAWVTSENKLPGTTAWQIQGSPPGEIAGYADHASAVVGDPVKLYVTTDATSFHVEAYRMGYYGGAGARLIWSSASTAGVQEPDCPVDQTTNMVACDNWAPSLTFAVTSSFVPGDYLLKLVGSGGQASYVPLTVRDPESRATYLLENDIYTWQAWNDWGGYDLYSGRGWCPAGVYPACDRARVVSFDRPYSYGQGAADFLAEEYPLVRFVEQHGLDVTYATSADFEQYPESLLQHRAILSLGHDECWSYHERLAAEAAEAQGVNLIFFGASPILRHVRLEASPLGADRQEVDYRQSSADPLDGTGNPLEVTGNTWQVPPASWSEVPFVGANYTGYVEPGRKPVDLVVTDSKSWLYAGTGLSDGEHLPGLLESDFDQVQPGVSPADVQVLGHSPMPLGEVQSSVNDPASDITYYTDAKSGAGIFDTGTVSWIPDIGISPAIDQMTSNLLYLFGSGPAGETTPSTANWREFYG